MGFSCPDGVQVPHDTLEDLRKPGIRVEPAEVGILQKPEEVRRWIGPIRSVFGKETLPTRGLGKGLIIRRVVEQKQYPHDLVPERAAA